MPADPLFDLTRTNPPHTHFEVSYKVAQLGKGSYGTVYRAEDKTTDAKLAVKISISDEGECDGRELYLLGRVQGHAHVVRLLDGACSPYFLVLVMEVGCMNLYEYMGGSGGGPVPPGSGTVPPIPPILAGGIVPSAFATALGVQVAMALEHVHSLDIIHRDLYTKNIVIRHDGTAMVVDFGQSIHVGVQD